MRVLIFTEGGRQIGLGHISRCSSLYDELVNRGIEVEFIINSDMRHFEIIKNKQCKIKNWLSIEFLTKYIEQSDYCIVDSYLANEVIYRIISNLAKRALFIDDNGRIDYPEGIVVNPSLSIEAINYKSNEKEYYLYGPKYIILRKPFIQAKREYISPQVKEVLITLGGSDTCDLTKSILQQLISKNLDINFNVVIGNAFKNIEELESFNLKNILFHENVTAQEMKDLMLKCDFAITAAGQTIYELLATQTPFIPIMIIENQSNNVSGLKEYQLVENILDYKDIELLQKIDREFSKLLNTNNRKEIIIQYTGIIDGLGSRRIIDKLLDH